MNLCAFLDNLREDIESVLEYLNDKDFNYACFLLGRLDKDIQNAMIKYDELKQNIKDEESQRHGC